MTNPSQVPGGRLPFEMINDRCLHENLNYTPKRPKHNRFEERACPSRPDLLDPWNEPKKGNKCFLVLFLENTIKDTLIAENSGILVMNTLSETRNLDLYPKSDE